MSANQSQHRLMDVLLRRGWIAVVCAIAAAAAAYVYSRHETKLYTATASLLFANSQLDQQLLGYSVTPAATDPTMDAATDFQLVSEPLVAQMTGSKLGVPPEAVGGAVSVAAPGASNIVTVSATESKPAYAAVVANTYAKAFISWRITSQQQLVEQAANKVRAQLSSLQAASPGSSQIAVLQGRLSQLGVLAALQSGGAQIANPAIAPSVPSAPHVSRNAGLGLILGLLGGVAALVLLERLDRRFRTAADAAATYGLTILGAIPNSKALARSAGQPRSLGGREHEAFRLLRAQLRYYNVDRKITTLLITSAGSADGKSTVAWHLSLAAAAAGGDGTVLLIEADLRRPTVALTSSLEPAPGLSEALTSSTDWRDVVQRFDLNDATASRFDVMTAGGLAPNPGELMESQKMTNLIHEAGRDYSFIVIDAPPALVVSDVLPLMRQVDGVIVVARLMHSRRDQAKALRQQLRNLQAPVLGLVLDDVTSGSRGYYGYDASEPTPAEAISDAGRPGQINGDRTGLEPRTRRGSTGLDHQHPDHGLQTLTPPSRNQTEGPSTAQDRLQGLLEQRAQGLIEQGTQSRHPVAAKLYARAARALRRRANGDRSDALDAGAPRDRSSNTNRPDS